MVKQAQDASLLIAAGVEVVNYNDRFLDPPTRPTPHTLSIRSVYKPCALGSSSLLIFDQALQ